MIAKLAVLGLLGVLLAGCATLTVAAIGGAIATGALSGGAKYGAGSVLQNWRNARLIERKCQKLKTEVWRQRCRNRLRYILHQYN